MKGVGYYIHRNFHYGWPARFIDEDCGSNAGGRRVQEAGDRHDAGETAGTSVVTMCSPVTVMRHVVFVMLLKL